MLRCTCFTARLAAAAGFPYTCMMAVALQPQACLVPEYTADNQSPPVLKSAGKALQQQARLFVDSLCLPSEDFVAQLHSCCSLHFSTSF